jgi:hypothetical protein
MLIFTNSLTGRLVIEAIIENNPDYFLIFTS